MTGGVFQTEQDVSLPSLPAYRYDPHPGRQECRHCPHTSLVVWCAPCRCWHWHGLGTGHRVAHCRGSTSPYLATGYVLEEVGVMTERDMRQHARVQRRKGNG